LVFLGESDGGLSKGVVYAPQDGISYVAVGDLNQDGKADIVASEWSARGLEVLLGNGDGTFQSPALLPLPGFTKGVVVADFNGDGWPDVAVAGTGAVYVLLNDGTGSLAFAGEYPISGDGFELVAADINNDAKLDLCIAITTTSRVGILLGKGDGTFSAVPDYDTTLYSPYGIAVGDLNKDGRLDLVVATSPPFGSIAVALGNGDGSFMAPVIYPPSLVPSQSDPSPGEVTLSDVNEDGNLDIVYAIPGNSSVGVLLGDGAGNFFGPSEFPAGGGSLAVAVADLNQDAWPDIVTADAHFSGVSVLYNASVSQPLPDFAVAANLPPVQVGASGTATAAISLLSTDTFSGSIQLECQNLPNTLSCSFVPSVLHLAKGATASSKLTITAVESDIAALGSGQESMILAIVPILAGMFFCRVPRARGKVALLALVASLTMFSGCQKLEPQKASGQTYTITITAVAWNGISHSVPMQVTIQR